MRKKISQSQAVFVASIVFIIASFSFDGYQIWSMHVQNQILQEQLVELDQTASFFQKGFVKFRDENSAILTILRAEKETNSLFQTQIANISSTVNTLDKLAKTDSELLEKYSKVYFLNENYIPPELFDIPENYLNIKDKPAQIYAKVWPYLLNMLDTAAKDALPIQILSAYRSFTEQSSLKSAYKVTYGSGANKFSADQGYSEHQLGTAIDLTTPKIGAVLSGMEKTDAYTWLQSNGYKYGFILSYPKGNAYYIFEPWHWRFVGVALATRLHNEDKYFYDFDQREINQYLVNIFD